MKGDTNCAQCGSAYSPCEQLARNAKKQWSDDSTTSITTQLKDVFKELFPSLSKAAQEKLKTSFLPLIKTPEPSKPTFLAQHQKLFQMNKKIEKQGHVAAQADSEFQKLLELKQEHRKFKQEMTAPPVTSTTEALVLPQPEAVADEPSKAEQNDFLAQEHALQAVRKRLVMNFAANPWRRSSSASSRGKEDSKVRSVKPLDIAKLDAPSPESW